MSHDWYEIHRVMKKKLPICKINNYVKPNVKLYSEKYISKRAIISF